MAPRLFVSSLFYHALQSCANVFFQEKLQKSKFCEVIKGNGLLFSSHLYHGNFYDYFNHSLKIFKK